MAQPARVEYKKKPLPEIRPKGPDVFLYAAAMRWVERMGHDYPHDSKCPADFAEAWGKVKREFGVTDAALRPIVEIVKRSRSELASLFETSIPGILCHGR